MMCVWVWRFINTRDCFDQDWSHLLTPSPAAAPRENIVLDKGWVQKCLNRHFFPILGAPQTGGRCLQRLVEAMLALHRENAQSGTARHWRTYLPENKLRFLLIVFLPIGTYCPTCTSITGQAENEKPSQTHFTKLNPKVSYDVWSMLNPRPAFSWRILAWSGREKPASRQQGACAKKWVKIWWPWIGQFGVFKVQRVHGWSMIFSLVWLLLWSSPQGPVSKEIVFMSDPGQGKISFERCSQDGMGPGLCIWKQHSIQLLKY